MDFIFDPSLALYLPLYELGGASFMSRDAYGHLCTPSGAFWTPRGYGFDGNDDVINCGSVASLDDLTAFTYLAWVNPDDYDSDDRIIDKAPKVFRVVSTGELGGGCGAATTGAWSQSTEKLAKDIWSFVAMTYDDAGDRKVDLFINLVEITYGIEEAAVGALNTDAASNLLIGNRSAGDRCWDGLLDNLLIFSRKLTLAEIQRIYEKTRGRYQ